MIQPIQPGTAVAWTSQSQGTTKTKQGTVLGFVPANTDIKMVMRSAGLPPWQDIPVSRRKFNPNWPSHNARYLVAVPRGNRIDYYAPVASVVRPLHAAK